MGYNVRPCWELPFNEEEEEEEEQTAVMEEADIQKDLRGHRVRDKSRVVTRQGTPRPLPEGSYLIGF